VHYPEGNSRQQDFLTESDDSPSGGAHLNDFPLSQSFDVTHRRLAKEAAVFKIELPDTFVSNLKRHRRTALHDPAKTHARL
jgi:hypothetical protein